MSSHDCRVTGSITLKNGVTMAQVAEAFAPLCAHFGREFAEQEIELEGRTLHFSIDIWGNGGYTFPEMDELSERLGPLVDGNGWFRLLDFDTGDTDAGETPYFVGIDAGAVEAARLRYGIEQMQPWVAPVIGQKQFEGLAATILEMRNR